MMGGYGGNVVGGLILGAGITLSGACPGTVMAQLGTGFLLCLPLYQRKNEQNPLIKFWSCRSGEFDLHFCWNHSWRNIPWIYAWCCDQVSERLHEI